MLTNDIVVMLVIANTEFNGDEIRAAARILPTCFRLGGPEASYTQEWAGDVIKIINTDLFYEAIKIAKEDGVWFERSGNVVAFEPVPLWEIRSLIGDEWTERCLNNPACFSRESRGW